MPKVGVELGMALKMASGDGFNFFKPLISISEIDTDKDLTPQIELSLKAIREVYPALELEMVRIIEESDVANKESVVVEMKKLMQEFNDRLLTLENVTAEITATEPTW